MNAYHNIPLRAARNRLLARVSKPDPFLSFPIRDLLICYPQNPLIGRPVKIYLLGAEKDVVYLLQDDTGNIVQDNSAENIAGETIETGSPAYSDFIDEFSMSMQLERFKNSGSREELDTLKDTMDTAGQQWLKVFPEGAVSAEALADAAGAGAFIQSLKGIVALTLPNITIDSSFSILAQNRQNNLLKTNLISEVNLRPFFQVLVEVKTVSAKNGERLENESKITIDAGDAVSIYIEGSKAKMEYKISNTETEEVLFSGKEPSFKGTHTIDNIENDINIDIRARRITAAADEGQNDPSNQFLLKQLQVLVRINQGIGFDFKSGITSPFAFDAVPELEITAPQNHVDYTLFRYRMTKPLFSFETPLAGPEIVSDAVNLNTALNAGGLTKVYAFKLDLPVPDANSFGPDSNLKEDSVLVVRAEKSNTGGKAWLSKRLVARTAQPDPDCRVQVNPLPPFLSRGETVQILIPDAQTGVAYQLKTAGSDIGPALLTDAHRIGWEANGRAFGMRIAEDETKVGQAGNFKVREKIEDIERVSVDPVAIVFPPQFPTADTEYSIGAIKEFTGLGLDLSQKIAVRIGYLQMTGGIVATGYQGIAAGQARAVEAWIRTSKAGPVLVWGTARTAGAKWLLRLNAGGKLELDIQDAQLTGTQNLIDGQWHHVACILAPPENGPTTLAHASLWVDGKLEIQGVGTQPINTGSDMDMLVGKDGLSAFFEGDMAEIRVWERAVPESDVQANRYQRLAGTEDGLALYWKLNDNTGTEATDSSGFTRNGTLGGGTWK